MLDEPVRWWAAMFWNLGLHHHRKQMSAKRHLVRRNKVAQ